MTTWYLVISRLTVSHEERLRHHQAHLDWLHQRHADGTMLFSGPTIDRELGIYVLQVADLAAARQRAGEDPYHLEGVRVFDVLEWDVKRTPAGFGSRVNEPDGQAGQEGE